MTLSNWLTLAGIVLVLVMAVYTFIYRLDRRVGTIENRCSTHQTVIDSIANLNSRLDKSDAAIETFWRVLGPAMAGIIHSPTAATRDMLVDKLFAGTIDADECRMLIGLLREAIDSGRWEADKKLAGIWVLARACMKLATLAGREECD
jgi:hypothetical protein